MSRKERKTRNKYDFDDDSLPDFTTNKFKSSKSSQQSEDVFSTPSSSQEPPKTLMDSPDIFDDTDEDFSAPRRRIAHVPKKKQATLHSFLSDEPVVQSKKRKSQLKMDLYVKWKDPKKLEKAETELADSWGKPKRQKCSDEPIVIDDENTPESSQSTSNDSEDIKIVKKSDKVPVFPSSKRKPSEKVEPVDIKYDIDSDSSTRSPLKEVKDVTKELKEREKMMKSLLNDSFLEKHHKGTLKEIKEEHRSKLKDGKVIRNKADRAHMHATDCPCCSAYYDGLDLSPDSKQKRIEQVGKHRYVHQPMPKTPEHYWEIGFPSESEQKRRGLIKFASPDKKNSKIVKKLF